MWHNQIGVNVNHVILDILVRIVIPVPLVIVDVMTSAAQQGMLVIAKDVFTHIAIMVTVLVALSPIAGVD